MECKAQNTLTLSCLDNGVNEPTLNLGAYTNLHPLGDPLTNVFVHFYKPNTPEPTNLEMLFSRTPMQGESVYINDARYEVVRVDHHPGNNPKPPKNLKGVDPSQSLTPKDAEIWLKPVPQDPNPLRSKGYDASAQS